MYLPSILMELEPEEKRIIGLVYSDNNESFISRFENQALSSFRTQDGNALYEFIRFTRDEDALEGILSKKIIGYIFIPKDILQFWRN